MLGDTGDTDNTDSLDFDIDIGIPVQGPADDPYQAEPLDLEDELIDCFRGGYRMVNLANEEALSEMHNPKTVEAAAASSLVSSHDELRGIDFDRFYVLTDHNILELPSRNELGLENAVLKGEIDNATKNQLINYLFFAAKGRTYPVNLMKYVQRNGIGFISMLLKVKQNESRTFVYTPFNGQADDVLEDLMPDKGTIAVFSTTKQAAKSLLDKCLTRSGDITGEGLDDRTQSIGFDGLKIYMIGREAQAALHECAEEARANYDSLVSLLLEGEDRYSRAPAEKRKEDPVPMEKKPEYFRKPTLIIIGDDEIVIRREGSRDVPYVVREASPDDEFYKTLFPQDDIQTTKIIVLDEYQKKKQAKDGA